MSDAVMKLLPQVKALSSQEWLELKERVEDGDNETLSQEEWKTRG